MTRRERGLDTTLVHAGEPVPRHQGAVTLPVYRSSTFTLDGESDYHDIRYIRLNNTPNHDAVHAKLAAIEGTEAALVTASGMAAISTTLLTLLRPGDHVLAQRCLYGGTHSLFTQDLVELGVTTTFIDADAPETWADALRPETRVLYAESITNPLIEVGDLPALAAFARDRGLVSVIDNTFATPINFQPAAIGFDLVVHSATKYLNGHSDLVAGAVMGPTAHVDRIKHKLDHLGGSLDPGACALLHRGLKTLAVRVRRQNDVALALAQHLDAHPAVARARYPGLASHEAHARARELFGGGGGMLSFEVAPGGPGAPDVISRLTLPLDAPSLGGVETLVSIPARVSHSGLTEEERRAIGVTDGLIRVSVGIEDPEDLIADFDEALSG